MAYSTHTHTHTHTHTNDRNLDNLRTRGTLHIRPICKSKCHSHGMVSCVKYGSCTSEQNRRISLYYGVWRSSPSQQKVIFSLKKYFLILSPPPTAHVFLGISESIFFVHSYRSVHCLVIASLWFCPCLYNWALLWFTSDCYLAVLYPRIEVFTGHKAKRN